MHQSVRTHDRYRRRQGSGLRHKRMKWPPPVPKGALDAVAARALALQRSTFLKMLRVDNALRLPDDAGEHGLPPKLHKHFIAQVKRAVDADASALIEKYATSFPPDCKRAPGHLQMASLAMAAQRVLYREARAGDYLATTRLSVRSVVADALGVVAPPDGTTPFAVPVQWVPNKIALGLTGALWLPARRRSMVERMMANFEADLGPAFALEKLEPSPSRRLVHCYYREITAAEGEDVAVLVDCFTAMHAAAWAGVPGFSFEADTDGTCTFRFSFGETRDEGA